MRSLSSANAWTKAGCPNGEPRTTTPRWASGLSPRYALSPSSAIPGGAGSCFSSDDPGLAQIGRDATLVFCVLASPCEQASKTSTSKFMFAGRSARRGRRATTHSECSAGVAKPPEVQAERAGRPHGGSCSVRARARTCARSCRKALGSGPRQPPVATAKTTMRQRGSARARGRFRAACAVVRAEGRGLG